MFEVLLAQNCTQTARVRYFIDFSWVHLFHWQELNGSHLSHVKSKYAFPPRSAHLSRAREAGAVPLSMSPLPLSPSTEQTPCTSRAATVPVHGARSGWRCFVCPLRGAQRSRVVLTATPGAASAADLAALPYLRDMRRGTAAVTPDQDLHCGWHGFVCPLLRGGRFRFTFASRRLVRRQQRIGARAPSPHHRRECADLGARRRGARRVWR